MVLRSTKAFPSGLRAYAISIAFWMPLSQVVGLQTYLVDRKEHLPVVLSTILLVDAARYLSVAILTPPIFGWVAQWPIDGLDVRRIVAYVLGYIPFSCAFAIIRWSLLPPWMEDTLVFGPRSLPSLVELTYLTFADVMVIYVGILVSAHAYSYFVRARNEEVERLQLRQLLTQSELQTLRAQLHPHFLFNTLQGISTLIETNAVGAQHMLVALAALLRSVLSRDSIDLINLKEELAFVRAYLDIERMRLGSRLEVRWLLAPGTDNYLLPRLILQPLIENAVVHGVANAREGGWIEVETGIHDNQLRVEIRNTIAGTSPPGLQVGLANVQGRLKHLYGDDARFDFALHADSSIAVARLVVPVFGGSLAQSSTERSAA
jgi:two-component system, LytTR family, sensor kinase